MFHEILNKTKNGHHTLMQPYMTMTEMAVFTLRKAILKGVYPPETRLLPGRLADEMGLGLAAVREALREMTGSGLVSSHPNKGYYVACPPTLKEVKEIFSMRFIAEKKAAEEGASLISDKDLDRMEVLCEEMCRENIDVHEFFLSNREFHLILCYASGMKVLCRIIEQMFDEMLIFRSIIGDTRMNYDVPNAQHKQIITAIKAGDTKAVGNLIVDNLKDGLDNILSMAKESDHGT